MQIAGTLKKKLYIFGLEEKEKSQIINYALCILYSSICHLFYGSNSATS
jgi:hypothetical protein